MTNNWVLDVLADLRAFAGKNGLEVTERQLAKVMDVAAEELASIPVIAQGTAQSVGYVGKINRQIAESGNT